jgi:hypothetical protein
MTKLEKIEQSILKLSPDELKALAAVMAATHAAVNIGARLTRLS